MKLTLDLALVRWSVVHLSWHELANDMPNLGAFLAGWFMRDMEAKMPAGPDLGNCRDSFRAGWREADEQLAIMAQREESA